MKVLPWLLGLAGLCVTVPAQALLNWQLGGDGELRALTRVWATAYDNPDDPVLYETENGYGAAGAFRLLLSQRFGQHWSLEAHGLAAYIPDELVGVQLAGGALDVERSAALERSFSEDSYLHAGLDQISLSWRSRFLEFTAGRQPVNLATLYFFAPNDFFAPYAAQTFYRLYKPGVDALRMEYQLGALSQLTLLSVEGYTPDPTTATGWSREPESKLRSRVGRGSATIGGKFDVAMLAGQVRSVDVAGLAIQGELPGGIGVRASGHRAAPDDPALTHTSEWAVGMDYRWESSLHVRAEYFHHGAGADRVAAYSLTPVAGGLAYLAREYLAVGVTYEATPLLNLSATAIGNLVDDSGLLALYGVYSLSDESELVMNLAWPWGRTPQAGSIRSEYGSAPRYFTLEWRQYY